MPSQEKLAPVDQWQRDGQYHATIPMETLAFII
jgi:hypothetical protein